MKSILVTNQKGGCGKTTITILLARDLQLRGYKVAVLDIDTQKSASVYFEKSTNFKIDYYTGVDDFSKQFKDYDYVVIDSSPRLNERLLSAMNIADFLLIPVTASQLDFWATDDVLALLDTLKNDKRKKQKINCGFVFNNCTNKKALDDIRNILIEEDYPILTELPKRVAFAVEINKTAFERKNQTAINEIRYLTDVILERI